MIGDIVCECDLGDGAGTRTLVGFENHAGRTLLGAGLRAARPGRRRPRQRRHVGLRGRARGRVLGTYVHGPLLPKNPWLADWLIRGPSSAATGRELEPLDDTLEQRAAGAAAAARH